MIKRLTTILMIVFYSWSCSELLEPQPVDLLVDNLALNEAKDLPSVRIGLYNAFRGTASLKVLAGDLTADMLLHNGTFSQYRELANKEITPSNIAISQFWGTLYYAIYVSNFILEKLPDLPGISENERSSVLAEAHFVRGYAYFTGLITYGKMPKVTSTNIETNINIPRSSESEILDLVLGDFSQALSGLPETSVNAGYLNINSARAALARLYLYYGDYNQALNFSAQVIESQNYELEPSFDAVVFADFTSESILEVGYTFIDDPGSSSVGLNNLLVGRREIIPSNHILVDLVSDNSGDRYLTVGFNAANLGGTDNGWSVQKYGTADQDNNNIVIFRLPEMYLISAESKIQNGDLIGAAEDINLLRERANAPLVTAESKTQMLNVVEKERIYELAYEGHRWYDLKRTGKITETMTIYYPNWKSAYELWPVPEREFQNNAALAGDQNPGY